MLTSSRARVVAVVVAVGVGVGIPFALVGARSLRALLYGITPFDPAPLASGAVVLVIVGAVIASGVGAVAKFSSDCNLQELRPWRSARTPSSTRPTGR